MRSQLVLMLILALSVVGAAQKSAYPPCPAGQVRVINGIRTSGCDMSPGCYTPKQKADIEGCMRAEMSSTVSSSFLSADTTFTIPMKTSGHPNGNVFFTEPDCDCDKHLLEALRLSAGKLRDPAQDKTEWTPFRENAPGLLNSTSDGYARVIELSPLARARAELQRLEREADEIRWIRCVLAACEKK